MEGIGKKIGYLKGLLENASFDPESETGKIFAAMLDVAEDLGDRVESMEELLDDLNDYVESIDDDLAELEGDLPNGDFPIEDDDFDFEDDDEDESEPLRIVRGRKSEGDVQELTLAGCLCPNCGKMFFVPTGDPDGAEYACPHCGKAVLPLPLTPDNAPVAKRIEK